VLTFAVHFAAKTYGKGQHALNGYQNLYPIRQKLASPFTDTVFAILFLLQHSLFFLNAQD
jgi:hypothetical protein